MSATIYTMPQAAPQRVVRHNTLAWTLGNVLMLLGVYLLLFVGGIMADEQYNVWAASGDSAGAPPPVAAPLIAPENAVVPPRPAIIAPEAISPALPRVPALVEGDEGPDAFRAPPPATSLSGPGSAAPTTVPLPQDIITRIQLPTIKVDKKVQEVGWRLETQGIGTVAVWEVAEYTVGHHRGTGVPGSKANIVLAGHSGGWKYPFQDLYYINAGDAVVLTYAGQEYRYTISEKIVVDQDGPGVTDEQRRENARYIESTDYEVVTLVTCWPTTGPDKFNQRVVVRAIPAP